MSGRRSARLGVWDGDFRLPMQRMMKMRLCSIQMIETAGMVLPLAILLIDSDEDRAFLTEMYLQYRALMYKTAIDFFGEGNEEVVDAVSTFVECNKRASYVVLSVGNVCRDRLREIMRQRNAYDDILGDELTEQTPCEKDVHGIAFDRVYALDMLNAFDELSERDLIAMRHIDGMAYDEMAAALHMKEGAVRTALSRAKRHLEQLGKASQGRGLMMNENGTDRNRSVQDKAYDPLGELLIERQTERLLKEMEEEKAQGATAKMDTFLPNRIKSTLQKFGHTAVSKEQNACFTILCPKLDRSQLPLSL